ncbi:MAG: alpha/beta fold hydrolase [Candidatus Omnitrophica bacterium]|nr:alpha/beta fold hydrolase [Candidatus Omnitrophota bacterium]
MATSFFRDPPRPAARCRYPILLLHGLFGFVQKRFGLFEANYFRGVAPYLNQAGNRARAIGVHPWQTIDYRTRQILSAIENDPELKDQPLNLIGHSMGGLDARYAVSALGLGDRVASVTTIATPHRGSFLADLFLWIPGIRKAFPAISNLTLKATEEFNREVPDDSRVRYLSIPASSPFWSCCPLLWPTWLILQIHSGANDGQVSLESAKWGEVLFEKRADHVHLIGMRYGLNRLQRESHLDIYGRITEELSKRGF